MKLLTLQIIESLPPIHSTENISLNEKLVICKFFTPDANWTWYVFEGEKTENDDFEFFGMTHGHEKELGYFHLSELQKIRGQLGLPVERDRIVFNIPYGKLISRYSK